MKTLLVIENDVDTIDIIESMYENTDYKVIKALKKLSVAEVEKINPNIIVLDHLLGDGYGGDLCLAIKANPLTKHIPVILYSASHHVKELAEISCADAYISKPFDLYDFMNTVDSLAL